MRCTMLQAISTTPATPMVRVPALDPAQIMHLLDAGAYGIICPMISTPEQAADTGRCLPLSARSATAVSARRAGCFTAAPDYVAQANETVMAIPMIETAEAVDRIDEILDVDGVDMIYLGPNDMAFALDGHVGHPRPKSEAALTRVLAAARQRDIPVGIFCGSGEEARTRVEQGFSLVTPGNDFAHLTRSHRDAVRVILADTVPKVAAQNGY